MFWSTALLALASVAAARKCRDITVDVSISAENFKYDLDIIETEDQATNFYLELTKQGANYIGEITTGKHRVTGTYQLATTYCEPDDGPGKYLQVMTHGVAFDRSYWDLPIHDYQYSYVDRALKEGYSTLVWDRLGCGESTKDLDTINDLQITLEIEALRELTQLAAQGRIPGVKHVYNDIIHVGHSLGSAMTYNLVSMNPQISKGVILTGFSHVPNFSPQFILGNNFVPVSSIPLAADKYPRGYVGAGSRSGIHTGFFAPGDYNSEVLDNIVTRVTPHGPGEFLSIGLGAGEPNKFTGPVMIITGDQDLPFCGGNCMATDVINNSAPNLIAYSKPLFPMVSVFNATVIPKGGHGLNLGYSSKDAYASMLEFLDREL